jgi:hypothetical protein
MNYHHNYSIIDFVNALSLLGEEAVELVQHLIVDSINSYKYRYTGRTNVLIFNSRLQ